MPRHTDEANVHLSRSRRGPEGFIRRSYSADDIDAVGAYCHELGESFLVPFAEISGQWSIQLRLRPAKNG